MATCDGFDTALSKVLQLFGIHELKDEQRIILDCLMEGKDCIAVLPTGFGKSLPFQIYLPLKREMNKSWSVNEKILVCCPLISLMQDQVDKLADIPDLTAAYKGSSTQGDENIKDGRIDIIYASPESLVGDPVWRSNFQKLKVSVLVIDEFHTIATWGADDDGTQKQAFRKWFAAVGELRSLFPSAAMLSLSATCTSNIRKRVSKVLQLKENTTEVSISPNKTNIKITVAKLSNSIEMSMAWLIDGLQDLKELFPKSIIYCNSINETSKLYSYIVTELPHCSKFVEMFHSETSKINKDKIISDLQNNGVLRIIISTSALGMGVDVKACNTVILYGLPKNIVDLIQEIGRVGRDGKSSVALILFNSYHLRQMTSELKDILKTTNCRRIAIMKHFVSASELKNLEEKESGKHTCCDLCAIKCSCKACNLMSIERLFSASSDSDGSIQSDDTEEYDASEYQYQDEVDLSSILLDDEQ